MSSSASDDRPRPPGLLARLRLSLRSRHYSPRTEQAYLAWIRRFIAYHDRKHPRELGAQHIEAFLDHLAANRQVSASTQNQALSALLFLYQSSSAISTSSAASCARSAPNDCLSS